MSVAEFFMLGVKNDYSISSRLRMEEAWDVWCVSLVQQIQWEKQIEAAFPDKHSYLFHPYKEK